MDYEGGGRMIVMAQFLNRTVSVYGEPTSNIQRSGHNADSFLDSGDIGVRIRETGGNRRLSCALIVYFRGANRPLG